MVLWDHHPTEPSEIFLAATSSSRSDDVTLFACLFACLLACLLVPLFFLALQHLQSVTLAMCNTCNMQNVQFATQPEVIFI